MHRHYVYVYTVFCRRSVEPEKSHNQRLAICNFPVHLCSLVSYILCRRISGRVHFASSNALRSLACSITFDAVKVIVAVLLACKVISSQDGKIAKWAKFRFFTAAKTGCSCTSERHVGSVQRTQCLLIFFNIYFIPWHHIIFFMFISGCILHCWLSATAATIACRFITITTHSQTLITIFRNFAEIEFCCYSKVSKGTSWHNVILSCTCFTGKIYICTSAIHFRGIALLMQFCFFHFSSSSSPSFFFSFS